MLQAKKSFAANVEGFKSKKGQGVGCVKLSLCSVALHSNFPKRNLKKNQGQSTTKIVMKMCRLRVYLERLLVIVSPMLYYFTFTSLFCQKKYFYQTGVMSTQCNDIPLKFIFC